MNSEGEKKKRIRIEKWAIFTVLFGVTPLFATAFASVDDLSLRAVIGHGELFLLAAVIMGDGFARIANPKAIGDPYGIACLGALVFITLSALFGFGLSAKDFINSKVISDRHLWASMSIFAASIITGYVAVIMEE